MKDKYAILYNAFLKACKYLREHPPVDAGFDGNMEILCLLVNAHNDPEGYRWAHYFLAEAEEELNKENKDEEYR